MDVLPIDLNEAGAKIKSSKKITKSADVVTTDDEVQETETEDEATSRRRPKPRAAYHGVQGADAGDVDTDTAAASPTHEPMASQNGAADPATPRGGPIYRQRSTLSPLSSPAHSDHQPPSDDNIRNGLIKPSESRKRVRSEDAESGDEQTIIHSQEDIDALGSSNMIPSPSQDEGEIQIRRKRIRH